MASTEHRKKPLNLAKRQTKKLSSVQAYTRLYYDKRLRSITDARWAQYITKNPEMKHKKGEQLRKRNEDLKELLEGESEEVKAEVEKRRVEGIDTDDEAIESEDDADGIGLAEQQRRAKAIALHKYVTLVFSGILTDECELIGLKVVLR
jgi:hypothetical protein